MATWFFDTGMAQAGQFSIMPLAWSELESYSRARRCDFSAWEFDTLMAMSRSYCSGHNLGCKQSSTPDEVPYIEDTEETRQAMRNRVLAQRDRNRKRATD